MCMDVMRALGSAVYRPATRLWANQATNWAALWTNPVLLRMINPDLTQRFLGETLSLVKATRQQPPWRTRHFVKHRSRFRVKTLNGHAVPLFSNTNPWLPISDAMLDLYWIPTRLYCQYTTYFVPSSLPSWLDGHTGECKEEKKRKQKSPKMSKKNKNIPR